MATLLDDNTEGPPDQAHASLALHRLRFIDWSPSTITSLAVSSVNPAVSAVSPSKSRGVLAIGRQNGDIELCVWLETKPAHKAELHERSYHTLAKGWVVHTVLPGQLNSKVEQLCFVNPPCYDDNGLHRLRLFSISGGAIVTEHFLPADLAKFGAKSVSTNSESSQTGRIGNLSTLFPGRKSSNDLESRSPGEIRTLPSLGGSVWSLAASPTGRYLAIGCEDGYTRIIDLSDNKFQHLANASGADRDITPRLGKAQGRVISLAWGPPVKRIRASNATTSKSDDSNSNSDDDDSDDDDDDDDEEAVTWQESFLVGGLGNSSAVVWDLPTGKIVSKLTVQKARGEATIVWSVTTLPDGTIATGDSTGRVTLFDPKTRVPIPGATFRAHASGADVLSLCVGPDGRALYSAGVDQKVAEYAFISSDSSKKGCWVQTAARRLHAHDIRAVTIDPPYDPIAAIEAASLRQAPVTLNRLPVLISGGVDFNLILTPASSPSQITLAMPAAGQPGQSKASKSKLLSAGEQQAALLNPISSNTVTLFADSTQRRVPFVPATGRTGAGGGGAVASVCSGKGWVVLRRETSIGIWDLGIPSSSGDSARDVASELYQPEPARWCKLLEMELKVNSNLTSVAVSPDGRFLAASDMYETKLFALRERTGQQSRVELEPRRIKSFSRLFGHDDKIAPGASAICFSPDSSRLVLCSWAGAYVHVIELPSASTEAGDAAECRLLRSFGHHRRKPGTGGVSEDSGRQIAGRGRAKGNKDMNGVNGHANGADHEEDDERVERNTCSLIHHAQISCDGAWLSTISSDLQHHVFSLDSLTLERTLPSPHAMPSGTSFHASRSGMLTLVYSDNKIEFWDVESGMEVGSTADEEDKKRKGSVKGGDWEHQMADVKLRIQDRMMGVREAAVGAFWVGTGTLLVWGPTWICTARHDAGRRHGSDEDSDVEMADVAGMDGKGGDREPSEWVVRLTHKYQPLLLVGALPGAQGKQTDLLVAERPFYELAQGLPPAFHRGARYGT